MKISYKIISTDASETPDGMRWITTKQKVRVLIPINATKEEIGKAIKEKYESLGIPLGTKESKKSVYVGSGTRWEKPSKKAIGSGYGTSVHGFGFYFTKNRTAAKFYREILTPFTYKGIKVNAPTDFNDEMITAMEWYKNPKKRNLFEDKLETVRDRVKRSGNTFNEIEEKIASIPEEQREKFIQNNLSYSEKELLVLEGIANGDAKHDLTKGQVTRVRIPSDKYLLNENLPLSEQSEFVKAKCKEIAEYLQGKGKQIDGIKGHGHSFYDRIANMYSQKDASELLNKFGIRGIKYNGDKTEGECFVIFNESDIRVQKRNITGDSNDTAE